MWDRCCNFYGIVSKVIIVADQCSGNLSPVITIQSFIETVYLILLIVVVCYMFTSKKYVMSELLHLHFYVS